LKSIKLKIFFYFGHPAQYLFLRSTITYLLSKGHKITLLIKNKDVLESLLIGDGFNDYINILPETRGKSKLSIVLSLLIRIKRIFPLLLKLDPNLLISSDASISLLGFLLRINRITITEDDYDVIKYLALLTYPFTNNILCPDVCNVGGWETKKIGYNGYMKLGYLHPSVFSPNRQIPNNYNLPSKYALIRLSGLSAFHDFGIRGMNNQLLDKIINILEQNHLRVIISSESTIDKRYQKYLIKINSNDMHNILSFSTILISDSQSMSVEAAMLGVPSLRYSGFAGKISVLEELENKYNLTFGILPAHPKRLFSKLNNLLKMKNLSAEFQNKRNYLIKDKINVPKFLNWFIENYPKSALIMKNDSNYQLRFQYNTTLQ